MRFSILSACIGLVVAGLLGAVPSSAQVTLTPSTIEPTAWTRIAVQVVNAADTAWTVVSVEVPEAIAVLGTDAPAGWTVAVQLATDTTPQRVTWSGGRVESGAFREFTFLARLAADVRRRELVFPVTLEREGGRQVRWRRGGEGIAPRMTIAGTTRVSSWAAFALAGAAFGLASLSIILAARRGSS